jgi:hypothetical protein
VSTITTKDVILRYLPFRLEKKYKSGDDTKVATLDISIRNGYPRLTSTMEFPKKGQKFDYDKVITAPFTPIVFIGFIDDFIKLITNGEKKKFSKIECYNTVFKDNVKTTDVKLQATVTYGVNSDGMPVLAVTEENKQKIVYNISEPSKWHQYYTNDSEQIAEDVIARQLSITYLNILKTQIVNDLFTNNKHNTVVVPIENKNDKTDNNNNNNNGGNISSDIKDVEELF